MGGRTHLLLSFLTSAGPTSGLMLITQGRASLPPVSIKDTLYTGTYTEFVSIAIQSIVGAALWIGSALLFSLCLKSAAKLRNIALLGLLMCAILLVYGISQMHRPYMRTTPVVL